MVAFSDPFRPTQISPADKNAMDRSGQDGLAPAFCSPEGWDAATLEAACRAIMASEDGSIRRVDTIVPCPPDFHGAMLVVEYARFLAVRYGLSLHCTVENGLLSITVERTGGDR